MMRTVEFPPAALLAAVSTHLCGSESELTLSAWNLVVNKTKVMFYGSRKSHI